MMMLKIACLTMMAGTNALLSYFLDYCFWENSIFSSYLPWLSKKILKKKDIHAYTEVKLLDESLRDNEYVARASNMFFFKMLGGCVICFNVWISFFTFSWIVFLFDFSFSFLPIYILTSHFFIRKLSKI